ncbi:MAG TPA: ABC transporter permease subunit [Anaerolineae bacterium]|jgi:ABC-2 type transport system permease protein|nr:ABC transporter permease subunit [Anaerolineae bacterium]
MIHRMPVVAITLRSLLDRRRFWLMLLLAAVPVAITLLGRVLGDVTFSQIVFDRLVIQTVLPLIALVFGTGALGAELEDGTIVYLLAKPGRRFRIVLAKAAVAAGLTIALVLPATLLTGLIVATDAPDIVVPTVAYALAAVAGGTAYALGFLTLSSITSRALSIGLGYVLLWEGVLAGLLPGTQTFSIRQATLGLADALQGVDGETLDAGTSVTVLVVVILGSLALGSWRMSRYQLRGGD